MINERTNRSEGRAQIVPREKGAFLKGTSFSESAVPLSQPRLFKGNPSDSGRQLQGQCWRASALLTSGTTARARGQPLGPPCHDTAGYAAPVLSALPVTKPLEVSDEPVQRSSLQCIWGGRGRRSEAQVPATVTRLLCGPALAAATT